LHSSSYMEESSLELYARIWLYTIVQDRNLWLA